VPSTSTERVLPNSSSTLRGSDGSQIQIESCTMPSSTETVTITLVTSSTSRRPFISSW
jgi:hypothetical protein